MDEIIETSEKNGLARSWKNSRVPKKKYRRVVDSDKTFSIGRGLYVVDVLFKRRRTMRILPALMIVRKETRRSLGWRNVKVDS